jgi:putative nucleotidyltransferase with HDIG domain
MSDKSISVDKQYSSTGDNLIKKVAKEQLAVGMFVHDINCEGVDPTYLPRQTLISDVEVLSKLHALGTDEVFIDLGRGIGPSNDQANAERDLWEEVRIEASYAPAVSTPPDAVEFARCIFADTTNLMRDMMSDIRLGKKVDMGRCESKVNDIMESVYSAPSVLLPLVQLKSYDQYTYQHSVAVSALAAAFGQIMEMPEWEVRELAMGGLLHDVGKALVPGRILNKPSKLDDSEFTIMKNHLFHTIDILSKTPGISKIALDAAAEHHERYDGSGYSKGLKGDEISLHGRMMGIVDVYDAITSRRVYHKGVPAANAMGRIFELGGQHFDKKLVQIFIKGVGIYPVGSLVRLESEQLGVVRVTVPHSLLQPIVQVIYDCKQQCHILPRVVDLSETGGTIVGYESYEKWGIRQERWLS